MIVTIFADASFYNHAGGWGAWAKSDRAMGSLGKGFARRVEDSVEAEMIAVVEAVKMARAYGIAEDGDRLIIQTDCQQAIMFFGSKEKIKDRYLWLRSELIKLVEGCTHEFRWVKGHQKNWRGNPRAAVNVLVDRLSRKGGGSLHGRKPLPDRPAGENTIEDWKRIIDER